MKVCPYFEYSIQILSKKWNGLILHYLSLCPNGTAHFSEIKRDIQSITPKALSLKLTELIDYELIEKHVVNGSSVSITYVLTEKGRSLISALDPIRSWAEQYKQAETTPNNL